MRNVWLASVALALSAIIAYAPASAEKDKTLTEVRLRMAHSLHGNSHYGTAANAFAETLESSSKGKYKVVTFPNNQLGSERDVIEGLQNGKIDLAIVSTSTIMDMIPEIGMFDIPFLMHDLTHARNVLDGPVGRNILAKFPSKGLIALAWGEQGFRHLTNNVRPVLTPEDAKGLRIRTPKNSIHIEGFRYIGIDPVPMTLTEAFDEIKSGKIDGQENSLAVILFTQLSHTQKYLSLSGHVYAPALILASEKLYKKLPNIDKSYFNKAGKAASTRMRDFVDDVEKSGVEKLMECGIQVTEVDRADFATAMAPVYSEYYKKFDKKIVDAIPFQRNFE
ncbi:TRAP-type C4-dicarboxylate transporter, periplasmic component [Candidatus Kinetoplastibacterium desouzaii TCC079E]|uniref:TRAP-type C4-dicarboxylate transporter, periplasmic component n=1 Tax=Candidatus Kinetoplastidibacterium desouzai TCC079E TaxID=1208919 RepID=M1LM06_9PROT|nr:TRAP transporter substrate-binding protein DctP [Candidatus Kinetoplastibacterium desouzaii]AGF46747.1 TRAP-type C4-dicarboxylate transporter, periplasmic component [Candidatus Kinetoplastibacterium desouzaii TCC079E]